MCSSEEVNKFISDVISRLNETIEYKKSDLKVPEYRTKYIKGTVARTSKVNGSHICDILNSSYDIRLVTLFKLLIALDVPPENFFDFKLPIKDSFAKVLINDPSKTLSILARNLKVKQYDLSRRDGLTQEVLAERLGYKDTKYVSSVLSGRKNIQLSTLYRFADVLEVKEINLLFK